jgi:hypothetical protein
LPPVEVAFEEGEVIVFCVVTGGGGITLFFVVVETEAGRVPLFDGGTTIEVVVAEEGCVLEVVEDVVVAVEVEEAEEVKGVDELLEVDVSGGGAE